MSQRWTDADVFPMVRAILAEILVLTPEAIEPSSRLVEDLDADSIAFLELSYRIREDFGLEVPEAKVDEETLTMPILDGLEKMEALPGGTTLFEFIKAEALDPGADDDTRESMEGVLADSFAEPDFVAQFKVSVAEAHKSKKAREAVASLLREIAQYPRAQAAMEAALAADPALARQVEDLGPALEPAPDRGSLVDRWRDLLRGSRARQRLINFRVKHLARLLGTEVPAGLDGTRSINQLLLRDLFRFVTVDAYVRYIRFMGRAARRAAS